MQRDRFRSWSSSAAVAVALPEAPAAECRRAGQLLDPQPLLRVAIISQRRLLSAVVAPRAVAVGRRVAAVARVVAPPGREPEQAPGPRQARGPEPADAVAARAAAAGSSRC